MATTQEALQVGAIAPSLTVDDLQASIKFYEGLGFAVTERQALRHVHDSHGRAARPASAASSREPRVERTRTR